VLDVKAPARESVRAFSFDEALKRRAAERRPDSTTERARERAEAYFSRGRRRNR